MIGLVLAAGHGRRLRPVTDGLPKALVPVDGDRTVLDIVIDDFATVGITEVVVIVGYAAETVKARVPAMEQAAGVAIELVFNDRAEDWNNAYSLWCAREHFGRGFVLSNGDTVHPADVERVLLGHEPCNILLAIDDQKPLADEEMKVLWSPDGHLTRINKGIDPSTANGEYIGVARVAAEAGDALADGLEQTWRRDPNLYYEDGFQTMVDAGYLIHSAPIGDVAWVEVDNHEDLARAREIACLY